MTYYYYYDEPGIASILLGSAGALTFSLLIAAATIAAMWMIFEKAGEPGWAAIVPFYNLYILYKITWGNGWMFLLLLIPLGGFVVQIITWVKLAKVFGKGGGWACGLVFLNTIFICIMGFSKEFVYQGIPGQYPPPGGYQQPNQGYQNPYSQGYQNPYSQGYQNPYSQGYQQPNPGYQPQEPTYRQSAQNPEYFYQTQEPAHASAPEQPAAKFCAGCGEALDESARFCPKCGTPR